MPNPSSMDFRQAGPQSIAEVWITPKAALAGHREGQFEIIFPTIRNLQAISRFHTSGELIAAAAAASSAVPTIEPRVIADGNGVRIVLPGDEGFEGAPPTGDHPPQDFNEAIRLFSLYLQTYNLDDLAAHRHIKNCRAFLDSPPPASWDGIARVEEK